MFWGTSFSKQEVLDLHFELSLFISSFTWKIKWLQISLWSSLFTAVQLFCQPGTMWIDSGDNDLPSQFSFHQISRHQPNMAKVIVRVDTQKRSLILFNPMPVWAREWQTMPSSHSPVLENDTSSTSVSELVFSKCVLICSSWRWNNRSHSKFLITFLIE